MKCIVYPVLLLHVLIKIPSIVLSQTQSTPSSHSMLVMKLLVHLINVFFFYTSL